VSRDHLLRGLSIMIFLVLSIVSSVLIGVVIRVNEGRGLDRLGVMLFNYIAATAFAFAACDRGALAGHILLLAPMAAASSFFFVTAFLVYMRAVGRLGLAVPVTITRLSVVLPVLGSMLLFDERLNRWQVAGLALALVAIVLFSDPGAVQAAAEGNRHLEGGYGRPTGGEAVARGGGGVICLAPLLFLLMGAGDFSLKVFREIFEPSLTMSFIFLVFAVSTLYTLGFLLARRRPIDRRVVAGGLLLGIPNFAAAYFILRVLRVYTGAVAFPLNNIGIILLSTAAGYLLWRERLRLRTGLAVLLAIVSVILLNAVGGG
jgi:multidrug transporter EmrE-like cation transporter